MAPLARGLQWPNLLRLSFGTVCGVMQGKRQVSVWLTFPLSRSRSSIVGKEGRMIRRLCPRPLLQRGPRHRRRSSLRLRLLFRKVRGQSREKARRARAKARVSIEEDHLDSVGTFVPSPRRKGDTITATQDNIGGDRSGQKTICAEHYTTYRD